MTVELAAWADAQRLVDRGALFALGDSGGKDSQAMRLLVSSSRASCPPRSSWWCTPRWGRSSGPARSNTRGTAPRGRARPSSWRARKTFFDMVAHRHATRPDAPAFPQSANRQCTSDLKRDPIVREVRRFAKAGGFSCVVSCMGLRADESARRRARVALTRSRRYSTAAREWWEWLPVHGLTTAEVFGTIREAGESPHPAYLAGNVRLSCMFCIVGSQGDAWNAAVHDPDLFARYVEIERDTGSTLHQCRTPLEDFAGITVAEARAARRSLPVVHEAPTSAGCPRG